MKSKILVYAATVVLTMCLAGSVLAQTTNYSWSAGGDASTWSQGANWVGGTAPVNDGTTFQIFIGTGFPTPTPTPIVISASDHVILQDQLFGPEWGETLNIYGSVNAGFGFCPVGAIGGPKTTVNLFGTASYTSGDSIFIGDPFWFAGGPNVDFNMYDSSTITTKYLITGGHLNLYDNSTANIAVGLLAGTPNAGAFGGISSDLTRWINLAGGKLVLTNGNTAFIQSLIARGIFLCYGKKFDTNEISIVDDGTNTIATVTNSLGTLNSVAVQASVTNMMAGTFQPALAVGNFANMSDVPLAYLDAAQSGGGTILYFSSNTNVLTVSASGVATAINPGTSLVSALYTNSSFGTFASANTVLFTVTPFTNSLVHRYSFSESSGSTTADSVGGPSWDGTLYDGATLGGGKVTLDSSIDYQYIQLPAGIVSDMDAVTVEAWANFGTPQAYAPLFAFGDQDTAPSPLGMNYIAFQPYRGTNDTTAGLLFGAGDPGSSDEQDALLQLVNGGVTNYLGNVHIVCVYHPYAGYVALYTNGILASINNNVTLSLPATLGADPLNYIGLSLYAADPSLTATIDEFRIYNGPLTTGQIAADYALGPDQLIGTNLNVSLSATVSGGNITVNWPTNSALNTLMSSPTLGPGANWTTVNRQITIAGGQFQMTVPVSSAVQFFRLQQ
ncbi:MAG TPA: LamG-like jellyroll fold domain-containing protein [Verrucomicrobiae bacterium]|nr:LamG-like jellyroll fold domain-containing protein [Verrucomicrobiae bacterium]